MPVVVRVGLLVAVAGIVGVLARWPAADLPPIGDKEAAPEEADEAAPPDEVARPDAQPVTVVHAVGPRTLADRGRTFRVRSDGGPPLVVVTPDGALMLLVVHVDRDEPPRLVVLDSRTLVPGSGGGRLPGPVTDLDVTPDGERIVWAEPAAGDRPALVHLAGIMPGGGHRPPIELPGGFEPAEVVALHHDRAVVRGLDDDGVPRLAVADLGAGLIDAEVALPVAAPLMQFAPVGDAPARSRRLSAAFAWDVDRNRGYVAHADSDRVSVLDLETGEAVGQLDGGQGRLRGIGDPETGDPPALSSVQHVGVNRQLLLSPDGERLYLGGWRLLVERMGPGRGRQRELPLGMVVFDVADGRVLHRGLPNAERVVAAGPDGRSVAVAGGWWADGDPRTVRLADTDSLATAVRVGGRAPVDTIDYTPSGRHALVARQWPGRATLTVVDVNRGTTVAERVFEATRIWVYPRAGAVVTWHQR